MSDYESHRGKIRLLRPNDGETLEDQCKRLYIEQGNTEEHYYEGVLFDTYYEKFIHIDGQIWEIFDHKRRHDDDGTICLMNKNEDESYSFYAFFYNGGTGLDDMIRKQMDKHKQTAHEGK